jgi:hypothetical protein
VSEQSTNTDPLAAAVHAGLAVEVAQREHERAKSTLTDVERWLVRIAIAEAMMRWTRAGSPDGGPQQFMDDGLSEARAWAVAKTEHA